MSIIILLLLLKINVENDIAALFDSGTALSM